MGLLRLVNRPGVGVGIGVGELVGGGSVINGATPSSFI